MESPDEPLRLRAQWLGSPPESASLDPAPASFHSAACGLTGFVRVQKQVDHALVPGLTGALQEKDEFAQQVGITQAMHLIELPVRLPAVMHQDGNPFGQNPVSLDRFPPTPGVDAVPRVGRCGDRC